jgi:dihydroorotate dehydrogenase
MRSEAGAALYALARPLLFTLDAERAHLATLEGLDHAHRLGATRLCSPPLPDDPVQLMGLTFPNPVGLAAGMDKDARHIDSLGALGFGFLELGTVTPRAQPGNPRPRLFRLPAARALINRFGFNNEGVEAFVARVRSARFRGVLGLNIGKNATTAIENAWEDYRMALRAVHAHAGYVAINISSPNTPDLRALQQGSELDRLLGELDRERAWLADRDGRRTPVAVKIAPDLADEQLRTVADLLVAHGIDAVIATNTTIRREGVSHLAHGGEAGGLSGAPLRERSTQVISRLASHLRGALPIIGVGGIGSGADAVEKLRAGASLVQVYTGLVYRGPSLVPECRTAISRARIRGEFARA